MNMKIRTRTKPAVISSSFRKACPLLLACAAGCGARTRQLSEMRDLFISAGFGLFFSYPANCFAQSALSQCRCVQHKASKGGMIFDAFYKSG